MLDTIIEWSVNILLLMTIVNLFLFSISCVVDLDRSFNSSTFELDIYSENSNFQKHAKNTNNDFFFVIQMIKILVYKYFCVFQTCYLRSINIIYQLVNDYFIVFNHLFFESFLAVFNHWSYFVKLNYLLLTQITNLLLGFPNNVFIFILLLVYICDVRNRRD